MRRAAAAHLRSVVMEDVSLDDDEEEEEKIDPATLAPDLYACCKAGNVGASRFIARARR